MTNFAWLLSMAVGFLSLSQEIIWVRVIAFGTGGLSQAFALVLFFFLVGIALGSAVGKRLSERGDNLLRTSAIVLGMAALLDLSLVAIVPKVIHTSRGTLLGLIVATAALKSVMFPIAHHLGSQQSGPRIGRSVSKVYFGNIVGSTLGPIVTGYVLLDHLTMDDCLLLIGLGTGLLSLLCAAKARTLKIGLASLAAVVPAAVLAWPGSVNLAAAIAYGENETSVPGTRIVHMLENRHGIIHTVAPPDGTPDIVMGGGSYDGRITVDMDTNHNRLDRGLVLLALHPNPERVLVVGLSGGAWVRALSASPRIKEITVLEINPGYLELIKRYPQVSGLLDDPRIRIVVGDGRRWLRSNPDRKFDLIVQNTTHYWRAYSSNLLSREYMDLCKSHLAAGGIMGLNSTFSGDVLKTAHAVFPFVERRGSFIYGSESDFSRPIPGAEAALREMKLDDKAVFADAAFEPGGVAREMATSPFVPRERQYEGLTEDPEVITEQNLIVEQAHGALYRYRFPEFQRKVSALRAAMQRQ